VLPRHRGAATPNDEPTLETSFAGLTAGYPLAMPETKSDPPDDHRELFEAERDEAEYDEEREDEAVHRTDVAAEEYEEEKERRSR
jgi:hypothetical protein